MITRSAILEISFSTGPVCLKVLVQNMTHPEKCVRQSLREQLGARKQSYFFSKVYCTAQ
jgi:hypothetical protein